MKVKLSSENGSYVSSVDTEYNYTSAAFYSVPLLTLPNWTFWHESRCDSAVLVYSGILQLLFLFCRARLFGSGINLTQPG